MAKNKPKRPPKKKATNKTYLSGFLPVGYFKNKADARKSIAEHIKRESAQ